MNKIKELSRNKDLRYKCNRCNTMIPNPGLCRECKEEIKKEQSNI